MSAAKITMHPHPPATAEELLDREEARAIQHIVDAVQHVGSDLCAAADVRRRISRHPFLATGLGAFVGFVGGPLILQAVKGALTAASSLRNPITRPLHTLPGLALASLRIMRTGR